VRPTFIRAAQPADAAARREQPLLLQRLALIVLQAAAASGLGAGAYVLLRQARPCENVAPHCVPAPFAGRLRIAAPWLCDALLRARPR
jgi:hypothetical protein